VKHLTGVPTFLSSGPYRLSKAGLLEEAHSTETTARIVRTVRVAFGRSVAEQSGTRNREGIKILHQDVVLGYDLLKTASSVETCTGKL